MPLHLSFATSELREICESAKTAADLLGELAARLLRARLSDIRAASDIREVLVGRPKLGAHGRVVFSLTDPHQLILVAAVKPIPRDSRKHIDWSAIDAFQVLEIR